MCAVEWKKLGDVCEVGTGSNNREDACDNGLYPFYVRSKDVLRINKYLFDEEAIIIPGEGGIGDIFHYANGKYGLHQRAYRVHPINDEVVCKYLYYYLSDKFKQYIVSKSVGATATSIRKPMLEGFMLPIPSLTKQQEIVSHLDTFTILISNLESELDMRRKQYEHYRNQLLDFEGVEGVEWKSLGELSLKITDGAHSSPKSTIEGYYMPSVKDMTDNGFDFSDCKIISKEDYEDLKRIGCQPNLNDILIAKDGSMLKYVFVVKEKLDIVVLSSIAIITPKIELVMPEYLVCYLKQSSFREIVIRDYSSKGGVPRIILKNFRKIVIPIPSRETQQEIVEKLDAFENLIQSLEQEIKLRKQQYEYYREKVLTFE